MNINDFIDGKENIAPLVPIDILRSPYHRFDLSRHNPDVGHMHLGEPEPLRDYIVTTLQQGRCGWGFGGWGEDRALYRTHPYYRGKTGDHSIHLGMDIWLPPGTPVHMPFTGKIYAMRDNSANHSYGPSVVTEHYIDDMRFYILFSHLHKNALDKLNVGTQLRSGDQIATVGDGDEGGIPSHVHIQLLTDLSTHGADFPEVARHSDKNKYLGICHNPESLLYPFMAKIC